MAQSIQEIIQIAESLETEDTVEFTDELGIEHQGKIVETQRIIRQEGEGNHRDLLFKSTGDTPDSTLEIWYDPEGGPVTVQVSFKNQDSREVNGIHT